MNKEIILILIAFACHFFGDFIFQSNWMALNKSASLKALLIHVLTYTFVFFVVGCFLFVHFNNDYRFFYLALITSGLHFCTDIWTSKVNSYLHKNSTIHYFFVGVGFDQLIHAVCLILTIHYLFGF